MVPAETIYRYNPKTKTVDESMSDPIPFKPGPRAYDIREKSMSDLEKIKDGIDMKSLFKKQSYLSSFLLDNTSTIIIILLFIIKRTL